MVTVHTICCKIKTFNILPPECICVFNVILIANRINWLVFVIDVVCVLFEAGSEFVAIY
jgi:hypothetical protein